MSELDRKDTQKYINIMKQQRERVQKENYSYKFSNIHEECSINIEVGKKYTIHCMSAFNAYIESEEQYEDAINSGKHHPISGPYNVGQLSENEDILVCLEKIIPYYDRVWSITCSAGALADKFSGCKKKAKDRHVHLMFPPYNDSDEQPMLGIVGTLSQKEPMGSGRGGSHGGNLDLPCIKAGSKVILPSQNRCSDVWFGDIHAIQGYGELAGVAAECSGTVEFRMFPIKLKQKTKEPIVIEPCDGFFNIYFVGCRNNFENAVIVAVKNAINFQAVWNSENLIEAYEKIGLYGNLVVGQSIGKTVSVAIKVKVEDIRKLVDDKEWDKYGKNID